MFVPTTFSHRLCLVAMPENERSLMQKLSRELKQEWHANALESKITEMLMHVMDDCLIPKMFVYNL